jgi:hypothetical protein
MLEALLENKNFDKFLKIINDILKDCIPNADNTSIIEQLIGMNIIKRKHYIIKRIDDKEVLVELKKRKQNEQCPFCKKLFSNENKLHDHLFKNHMNMKKVKRSQHLRPTRKSENIERSLKNAKNENINEEPLPRRNSKRIGRDYVKPDDALNYTLPGSYESSKKR